MRNITEKSRAILKFYKENKSIIKIGEAEFKNWLEQNYFATRERGKFIATQDAVENGYMVNKKKAIIDLEEFNCFLSYSAYITKKGQEHILNLFLNEEEV